MRAEKLNDLIENSDWAPIQKTVFKGFVSRCEEDHKKELEVKELIKKVSCQENISEVILSTDDVKIYTITGNKDWDKKYPYRVIYFRDGKWHRCSTVSPNLDIAYLVYLKYKHLGGNSQFVEFVAKMLEIKID